MLRLERFIEQHLDQIYRNFNWIEAGLWWLVALYLWRRVPRVGRRQTIGVGIGVLSFLAFGLTDVFEASTAGRWSTGLFLGKVTCGIGIFAARHTYIGWRSLRWRDRELWFGLFCLACAVAIFILSRRL